MKFLNGRKIMSSWLTVCMVAPSALAQSPAVGGALDEVASPTADSVSASNNSTLGLDAAGSPKTVSLIMRGVSLPKAPITMDFQDADVRDVIHLLAVKSSINMIYGVDVAGPITIHLDRVPFDQAFQTVLTLKNLVALPMGPKVVRIVSSTGLTQEQSQAATFTRVFRLNYADADSVKRPIDAIRAAAGRKGVTSTDAKTNSLIITDTQEGLKEAEDLIPTLDKKPSQVDIEAKIVEVSLDKRTAMGISWGFARTASGGNLYGGTTATAQATAGGTGAATGQTVISPNLPGGANSAGATGVNMFVDDARTALDKASFSFIHGEAAYLLAVQLTALSNENRLKVLSNPHVVTTNNEEANIDVINKIPYQVSQVSNGTVSNSVQFVEAGVKLKVKPTVNADRRITLKVHPEVSNTGQSTFSGAPPVINTRDADTTVVLRDGETIAIGGLITEQTQRVEVGIPFLMQIPILGYLFKSKGDSKQRVELIVFLTPKIAGE